MQHEAAAEKTNDIDDDCLGSRVCNRGLSFCWWSNGNACAYWNYACKGAIGEAGLLFDRNYLVIMPKKLAQGRVLGIRDGSIATFESADVNSGLAPTMVFSRGDQKVTLVEASSKQTSDDAWSSAHDRRFWNRTTFIKRYRYENNNFGFGEIIEGGKVMQIEAI